MKDELCADNGAPTTSAAELTTLLQETANGNTDSFAEFYQSTRSRLLARLTFILRSPILAEEVSQEVYLHVWIAAGNYDADRGSPMTWLMMFAHRRAVDRVRAEQSLADRERVFGNTQFPPDRDVVYDEVGQRFVERAVAREVHKLRGRQREAVVLAFYGDRTYAQVAVDLGISVPTAKSRIRAGLITLGRRLSSSLYDLP
ncbi:sigma-70 family RNA polymerase sigma factor [Nocardia nova]|uniref:RNA polymerase subunit sigma n=1 Tax=Nocardia nova TaxID=37330 RepID=A0A2S5ZUP9_9NOCA|nr:sigma-70 family RNA polymerase sigma factor [Nocardia nova]PPJ18767.1 RNA polymerase subunit sigma [Nocardia nova]